MNLRDPDGILVFVPLVDIMVRVLIVALTGAAVAWILSRDRRP